MRNIKKAFVFDFDDTLAQTACMIKVVQNGETVKQLTPSQYNSYILASGESFDYSDFEKIINPTLLETFELAKQVYAENHAVYVLTARGSKVKNAIVDFMRDNGIETREVYCVGDSKNAIEYEKRTVLMSIMERYEKTYFYDDHAANIEEAKKIGVKSFKV
jgi:phosphoserine phosphatase